MNDIAGLAGGSHEVGIMYSFLPKTRKRTIDDDWGQERELEYKESQGRYRDEERAGRVEERSG